MSNYYEYKDVAELIAHRLMKTEGWTVYGFKEMEMDMMTDYYSPSYWSGGTAMKNGYKFVFNQHSEVADRTYTRTVRGSVSVKLSAEVEKKIKKLEAMTMERGATEAEEKSAKEKIAKLRAKEVKTSETDSHEEEIFEPGHLANPPRCNWHIEKDGIIIDKGTGMLKFRSLPDITREREQKEWQKFNTMSESEWIEDYAMQEHMRWNTDMDKAREIARSRYNDAKETYALLDKFNEFIAKVNSTCGGMMGSEDEFYTYETVKETKYKKEMKFHETPNASLKDGVYFKTKGHWTYGCGNHVYCLHYNEKWDRWEGWKMNGKLTKECHGSADKSNHFYVGEKSRFEKFVEKGVIILGKLVEEKVPYEVEKVVKKKKTAEKTTKTNTSKAEKPTATNTEQKSGEYTYDISESVHTKTNEPIWLVKIVEKLSREEYIKVNKKMKELGGYYSKFTHSFIFKSNPTEKLA